MSIKGEKVSVRISEREIKSLLARQKREKSDLEKFAEECIARQEAEELEKQNRLVELAEACEAQTALEQDAELERLIAQAEESNEDTIQFGSEQEPAINEQGEVVLANNEEVPPEEIEQSEFEDLYMDDRASRFNQEEDVNAIDEEELDPEDF